MITQKLYNHLFPATDVAGNRGAGFVKCLVQAPCARTKHLTRCHGIACAFGPAIAARRVSAAIRLIYIHRKDNCNF